MQFNSTETNEQKVDSSNINLPLLFLGFLFLVVILLFNGINQWRSEKQLFKQDIVRSLDDFSRQSGLLAQASYHTNLIFVRSHIELLSNAINDPKQYGEHLWTEANLAIFNLTGLVLLNEYGRSAHRQGPDLNRDEVDDIWQNIKSFGSESGMFILRYGKDGGFYFFNRYQAANGKLFYFVSRRSYSALSSTIFENKFQGFEVILIDTRYNSIMMREGYYADSSSQPLVDDSMHRRVLYQAQIPQTYLAVAAIPKPVNLISELWRYLRQPVLIICVFIVLSSSLLWMLRRQEMTAQQHMRRRHLIEQRANKALNAIDDAFISTDSLGFVTYANPKGEQLLREQGHQQVIGEPLSVLWPSPQALWNRGLTVQELEDLNKHNFQLNINLSGRERIFEQMCNPLLEGNEISGMVWLLRDVTEEILAHRALEESQQRYKILFDEAGVGHCLFDIDEFKRKGGRLHVVSVNESAVQMAGAPDKNYFIAHFTELTDGPNNAFRFFLQRAIALRQHFTEFELPITTFMGEKHYLWVSISLRSGIDGQVLASFVDITEQKRQNEQIREREAFWGKIMDAMPDIVYVAELDDQPHPHVIYRNRTLGQLLGYEHDNSDGNNWMTYADRDESQRLKKVLLRIKKLKMGETFEYVSRFFHKNGSIRVIKFRDTPFLIDEKGEVVRYIGSIRDVTEDVEQQEKILESERRYRLLAENINDIIWATDLKLNFNFISSSVTQILGYKPDELLREGVANIFKESDIALISRQIKGILNNAQANNEHSFKPNMVIRKDLVVSHKLGMEMLLEVQASPLWNDSGELMGVIGTCRDVGESRRVEQELQLAAEVFANSNEGIMITDTSHKIVKLNAAFCNMTGYTPSDVLGKAPNFIVSRRKHDRRFLKTLDIALASDGYWQGEIAYEKADGEIRTGWAGISAVRDKDYEIQSLIIILSDITERKASEERIHKLAYFDALTGLPNRTQLNERLGLMLKSGEKNNQSVALLFIDLDRFKPINDSMGHPAGDLVLKEVALRLQSCVKKHDIICRMGGDEFTIAIGNQISAEAAAETSVRVAERILKELGRPYVLNDREVFLSGSIGVAIYPHDASTATELLKNADMAMYHSKETGRNKVQFYTQAMNQKAVELLELENDLRHALVRNELEVYYQPQYHASNGRAVSAEALLRWNHPSKGIIPPVVFIPIIEDTGLIVPVGLWVLEQACTQFMQWQSEGFGLSRIAVNVSVRQFKQDEFLDNVRDVIARTGILPYQLELELTESILIDDLDHTLNVLRSLGDMGVRTAIDDFGTGYSSLNYLKQFPVDVLKIDRSFIQNLPDNKDDAQITRTIIAMAHNLGLGVIAEGVETQAQLDFLNQANCEEVQGYLFNKPLRAVEFAEKMRQANQA